MMETFFGRRARRLLLAVILVTALAATGCGDDDDDDSGSESTTTVAPDVTDTSEPGDAEPGTDTTVAGTETTTTVVADAADPAGVVRVGYDLRPESGGAFDLDPTLSTSGVHDAWLYMVYGRLLRPTQDGGVEPDLAESATVVDPNTIEVTLREGLTFSDGSPFDAEAVKVGLERNLAEGDPAALSEPFFALTGVEAVDPTTVRLTIGDGTAPSWYNFLAQWQTSIAPDGVDPQSPIGAGPFVVTSFEVEQAVVFEKSETYWDAESILIGGIEIVQIASDQPQSGTAALQADQIDLVITDAAQIPALTGNLDVLVNTDANQTVNTMFCKTDGPLADPLVRRAINMAIDREAIGEAIYAGTASPSTQPWPDGHVFNNPDLVDFLAYDPDAAAALLEEAGYADGFDIDMYVIPALSLPDVAQVMQQQLGEVGITLNLITANNYVEEFLRPQVAGIGLYPGNAANRMKLDQWTGDAIGNACGYDDPELNELVGQLRAVSDDSPEAADLWHQIEEIVVGDALSGFFLFRAGLAGYNTERLGAVDVWPIGNVIVPDPRETWVNAEG